MNYKTNKFIEPISNNNQLFRNDFYGLWICIANTFVFDKICTNENVSSRILDPNHITIYNSDDYYIVMNKSFRFFSDVFVVPDRIQSNRYFIGFNYKVMNYTDCNICGLIIYFDSDGNMAYKSILHKVICNYDCRDGLINTLNSTFYNQTLLFFQVYRDSKQLNLFVNLLDWEDHLLCSKSIHNTNIIVGYTSLTESIEKKQLHPRFYFIKTDLNNYISIDLGSLKLVKKTIVNKTFSKLMYNLNSDECIQLDYSNLNSLDNINNFLLENDKIVDGVEYSDIYPTLCIKCNQLTKQAEYGYENSILNLGNSYCINCQIRYSFTEKCWVCCGFINYLNHNSNSDIFNCSSKLNSLNNYVCANELNHIPKTNFKICYKSNSWKYPFKEQIKIIPNI